MKFDVMVGAMNWQQSATLARQLQDVGFSGMLFTESSQTPWMSIAAAATAAQKLDFSTGIAVAFPRSPMIAAQNAWELAANTEGRFRLGLGSQVKGHVVRRYSAVYDKPALQMRDYVSAFKACIRAFVGEEKLHHEGPYYNLSYLPSAWAPARHNFEDIKIDISAVGPMMCHLAGELCNGIHVHPMHSTHYIQERLLPAVTAGTEKAGRSIEDVDLFVPVFAVAGDTPEARAALLSRTRTQIAFYGSTPNYAFQFDDLGFTGLTAQLGPLLKNGDLKGMADLITDEVLDHFAVVAGWDDMADALLARYGNIASRVVTYLTAEDIARHPEHMGKWGEIARAVTR
jgi:probable F420-dependent oxidoreductase